MHSFVALGPRVGGVGTWQGLWRDMGITDDSHTHMYERERENGWDIQIKTQASNRVYEKWKDMLIYISTRLYYIYI